MKRTWILMLVVALVGQVQAMDVLVGGSYYDSHQGSLWNDGYGGDVQLRIPVVNNLDFGIGTGYYRYNLDPTSSTSGRWCRQSVSQQQGSMKAIPIDLSGIYKIPAGPVKIEAELGVKYLFVDVDTRNTDTSRRYTRSADIEMNDFWVAHAGLNVVIPIGMPSIVVGGGYQMELGRTDYGSKVNNMSGAFAKVGLMLPI